MMSKKYSFLIISLFIGVSIFCIYSTNIFNKSRYSVNPPNIILVTIDALRPDHMSCYNYQRNTTPFIDKLAKEGIIFTQAISNASWTVPSMPSMFTSTYPHVHRVYTHGQRIDPTIPTLAEMLKAKGYVTKAVLNRGFKDIKGIERGFDVFYFTFTATDMTQMAKKWLAEEKKEPFFLWLHYNDVHGPYNPPPPYDKIYLGKLSDEEVKNEYFWVKSPYSMPIQVAENRLTHKDLEYYISQYDGAIRFIDEQIKELYISLELLALSKNTVFIITADHGESLGEHKNYFCHGALYDEVLNIPLIIRYDTLFPKVSRINDQVQSIDILPTILDIVGVRKNKYIKGESLLPLIKGEERKRDSYVFLEHIRPDRNFIQLAIRTKNWKLIQEMDLTGKNKIFELYDLRNDKKELFNIAGVNNKIFKILKEKIDDWDKVVMSTVKSFIAPHLDKDTKEKLKSLGYMQ